MNIAKIMAYRNFLKDSVRGEVNFKNTHQNRGVPPPPVEKPVPEGAAIISLPEPGEFLPGKEISLYEAILKRKSAREYLPEPFSLDEISFMLWASQGARGKILRGHLKRTVPSAGCRHALETYVAAMRVEGLEKGVYRFLPVSSGLLEVYREKDLEPRIAEAALGQEFAARAAAAFIWTAVPYRMEWRYGEASHKVIALDAGHACQNLCLSCLAFGGGACPVAAYDQELSDALVEADGQEEFVIYMAPAGKTAGPGQS